MSSNSSIGNHIYTLGIASKLSGIPVHSIRQYVDKGLVLPLRTDTNRHLFSDVDIERLKKIKDYIDSGLNIAGLKILYAQLPGFLINSCPDEECHICSAFQSTTTPCWLAKDSGLDCNNRECRECEVYGMADPVEDLKAYFLSLKNN